MPLQLVVAQAEGELHAPGDGAKEIGKHRNILRFKMWDLTGTHLQELLDGFQIFINQII